MLDIQLQSPERLWWCLALIIPVALHFWRRRKYQVVRWSAMQFVVEARRQVQQKIRIRKLGLLLLRMVTLVLFIVAVANPNSDQAAGTSSEDPLTGVHHVLLVDATYSMGARGTVDSVSMTAFELAQQRAAQYVRNLPQEDRVSVITISTPAQRIIEHPVGSQQGISEELNGLTLSANSGDAMQAIQQAASVARRAHDQSSNIKQTQFVVYSDFEQDTWRTVQPDLVMDALSTLGGIEFVDCGQPYSDNLAIQDLSVEYPAGPFARRVSLRAEVVNYSATRSMAVELEWTLDDRVVQQQQIQIEPGEVYSARLEDQQLIHGNHVARVRISDDALSSDNTRWAVFSTPPHFQVLCVEGRFKASQLLQTALVPSTDPHWPVQITTVSEGAFDDQPLSDFDLIALCNVRRFGKSEMQLLTSYVDAGGMVFLLPGDRIDLENYNHGFGSSPDGFDFPLKWNAVHTAEQLGIDLSLTHHEIASLFHDHPKSGIEIAPIYTYIQCAAEQDSSLETVLALNNSDPLFLLGTSGQGCVFILTTSVEATDLENRWSELGSWPSFLPLIHESLAHVVQVQYRHQNQTVGQPIHQQVDLTRAMGPIQVRNPSGRQSTIASIRDHNSTSSGSPMLMWQYTDTNLPGIYSIVTESEGLPIETTRYAFNINGRESQYATLDIEKMLVDGPFLNMQSAGNEPRAVAATRPWFPLLLLVVLGLTVVELFYDRERRSPQHNSGANP